MKYRVLLMGRNNSIIDDFFKKMSDSFESLSTSVRYEDIICHIKYFKPHVIVYCISNEVRDTINRLIALKFRYKIPFIIIGSEEECTEFEKIAVNVSNMTLTKPLTANVIEEKIVKFMEQNPLPDERSWNASGGAVSAAVETVTEPLPAKPTLEEILGMAEPAVPEKPQRRHILVVDDSVIMLKVIKEHLAGKYDIATATSGRIALRFLDRKKTDLILLDYEMPEENGVAVLEKLRANDATKDIPVVFLTGTTEREKIQKALIMKPQGYLLKPIDREKLMTTIENIIG